MIESDYPSLSRSSSAAARGCQWWFLLWVRLQLFVLAATGIVTGWSPSDEKDTRALAACVALLMFIALIVGIILKLAGIDDAWFRARAFAENAKSAAWRFMMTNAAEDTKKKEKEERAFLEELRQIRGRFPQLEKTLSKYDQGGEELTPKMKELRERPWSERAEFYKQYRVQDQIEWYRMKAKLNADAESTWFTAIIVCEAIAVVLAVVRVICVHQYDPTGTCAAIAACLLAWSQTKRFSDLSNTYGVACRDLNGLLTRAEHIHDETGFQKYVNIVETAVSREHRLWLEKLVVV